MTVFVLQTLVDVMSELEIHVFATRESAESFLASWRVRYGYGDGTCDMYDLQEYEVQQ
jgi:hypothetical protein